MTNTKEVIKLGVSISDYRYDESTQRLYVSGPALEEGTWTGMNNTSTFFPRSVIHAGSHLFEGVDFVCEHQGLPIGKVLKVENTEFGFNVIEGYITHKASINSVLSGKKRGFSIEAAIVIDPVRRVAEQIVEAINISLVETPACRVCGINNAQLDKPCPLQGNVAMSDNIEAGVSDNPEITVVADQVAETPEPVVMGSEEVVETAVVDEDKTSGAFQELSAAAEAFKTATAKLNEVILGLKSKPEEPKVEVVAHDVLENIEPLEVVEATPEIEVVAQAAPEEAPAVEEAIVVPPVPVTSITDVNEIKFALSEAATTVSGVANQLAELTSKVQILEVQLGEAKVEVAQYKEKAETLEAELKSAEASERDTLIAEIKELDPDVDGTFIAEMTVTQLSAYKANVTRIVSKKPLAEKKSVKRDETSNVELSAPKETKPALDLNDPVARKKFIEASLL